MPASKKMTDDLKRAILMAVPDDHHLSSVYINRRLEERGVLISTASVGNACIRLAEAGFLEKITLGRYVHYRRKRNWPEPKQEKEPRSFYHAEDGMRVSLPLSLPPATWKEVS